MKSKPMPSPWPYYFLSLVLAAAALGEISYPNFFFAYYFRFMATGLFLLSLPILRHGRGLQSEINDQRKSALREIQNALSQRQPLGSKTGLEADGAERLLSRIIRNSGEDLAEIRPDYSTASLKRLVHFFPRLLEEIGSSQEAFIRIGVVGAYLGELACRQFQWRWHFRRDPSLRQFSYLASVIQRKDVLVDPFEWAAELMENKKRLKDWLEIVQ